MINHISFEYHWVEGEAGLRMSSFIEDVGGFEKVEQLLKVLSE